MFRSAGGSNRWTVFLMSGSSLSPSDFVNLWTREIFSGMYLTNCKTQCEPTMRLSRVEFEILNLLRSKEMYGLEMVRVSSILKRGTVYVTLDRMSDKGLVKSRIPTDQKDPGLPRRLYSATGLGQRAFHAQSMAEAIFAAGGLNA